MLLLMLGCVKETEKKTKTKLKDKKYMYMSTYGKRGRYSSQEEAFEIDADVVYSCFVASYSCLDWVVSLTIVGLMSSHLNY